MSSSSPQPFRLTLFGSPALSARDRTPITGRATQRHRLALLALLGRSPETGLTREALMGYLWPERDPEGARNLLKASVYVLRQALGDAAIRSTGDQLCLASGVVDVDVIAFEAALGSGDLGTAVALYHAPFLDGFHLKEAAEFGHWVDRERARLADSYSAALEELAEAATGRGDTKTAASWWKARAAHDPYDSRVALRLMEALVAAGSRAGAVRHAAIHAHLLREELGLQPSGEVEALAEALREDRVEVRHGSGESGAIINPGAMPVPPGVQLAPTRVLEVAPTSLAGSVRRGRVRRLAVPALGAATVFALFWSWTAREAVDQGSQAELAEDIARAVAREMGRANSSAASTARSSTSSVSAWDLYRRASQPEVLRSDSASREALDLFRRAVDLDSGFAGAHAGLARMYLRIAPPEDPNMSRVDRLTLARQHASQATLLDQSLAEAHGTLGIAEMSLYHFDEAESHLLRALELDPADGSTRGWLVQLYVWMGRFERALEQARSAVEADPLSASARGELARALLVNGRCEEALAQLTSLADLEPQLLRAGPIEAQCHAQLGMWDQALDDAGRGLGRAGAHAEASLGYFLARAGRREEATAVLDKLVENARVTDGESFWVVMVLSGLGDLDEAFEWLERAVADHSVTFEVREPRFSDLHVDPRFGRIMGEIGLDVPAPR